MENLKINDMNACFIHYYNIKSLKQDIIKENIKKIINELQNINKIANKHKYLCLSCIFGGFFGDSIGAHCEFSAPSQQNYLKIYKTKTRFLAGEITDDSELSMAAGFAYMDAKDGNDPRIQDLLYYHFGMWKESGPKDMGRATYNSLKYFNSSYNIEQTKYIKEIKSITIKKNWNSLSNGALMRISTFIVFYYYTNFNKIYSVLVNYFSLNYNNELNNQLLELFFDIFNKVIINVEITHPNLEVSISTSVFCLMVLTGMIRNKAIDIYSLFKTFSVSTKFSEISENKEFNHYAKITQQKFINIIKEIESNKQINVYNKMGYYIHGFKLSVYYLYRIIQKGEKYDSSSFYNIMAEICNLGGDTDTNCAIVGTMIGPLIGYQNFKKDLFDIFINYFPQRRTQYTSAFMYIYVNYLEEKYLNNARNQEINKINVEEGIYKYPSFVKLYEFLTKRLD